MPPLPVAHDADHPYDPTGCGTHPGVCLYRTRPALTGGMVRRSVSYDDRFGFHRNFFLTVQVVHGSLAFVLGETQGSRHIGEEPTTIQVQAAILGIPPSADDAVVFLRVPDHSSKICEVLAVQRCSVGAYDARVYQAIAA